MQPLETDVAQIKLNVRKKFCDICFYYFWYFYSAVVIITFWTTFLFDIVDNFLEGLVYSILPFVLL
jgi:hypothetical protein